MGNELITCPKCFHQFEYLDYEPNYEDTSVDCYECDFEINCHNVFHGHTKQDADEFIDQFIQLNPEVKDLLDLNLITYPSNRYKYTFTKVIEDFLDGNFGFSSPEGEDWIDCYTEAWKLRNFFPQYQIWKEKEIVHYRNRIEEYKANQYAGNVLKFFERLIEVLQEELPFIPKYYEVSEE